jgi:hypothetical protein
MLTAHPFASILIFRRCWHFGRTQTVLGSGHLASQAIGTISLIVGARHSGVRPVPVASDTPRPLVTAHF